MATKDSTKTKDSTETVEIPSGITAEVKGAVIIVSASGKTFEVKFNPKVVNAKIASNVFSFSTNGKATKPRVSAMRSIMAHVKNTFIGATKGFSKQLQVVYSHFPVSMETKGKQVIIKNFLGEKKPRVAEVIGDTKVEVKGQDIAVSGTDKYSVGQTANNLMAATKIREKDRRVFQDGIYPVI